MAKTNMGDSKQSSQAVVITFLNILFILPLYLSVGFGDLGVYSTYVFYLFQVVVFTLTYRYVLKYYQALATLFVAIIAFQNLFIGLSLNLNMEVSLNSIMLLISFSSMYPVVAAITVFFIERMRGGVRQSPYLFEWIALGFMFFASLYFFKDTSPLFAKFGYLRNFTVFFFIYLLGRYAVKDRDSVNGFIKFIFVFGFFLCVFGFIERFILSDRFWLDIVNIWRIGEAKNLSYRGKILPGVFDTDFLGVVIYRLASTFGEPVNASYFFSFVTVLAFIRRKVLLAVFFAITLALTFGKGGILVCGSAIAVIVASRISFKKVFTFKKTVIILLVFIPAILFYARAFRGSTLPHVAGLMSIKDSLLNSPFGHGLGSGGNWGRVFDPYKWKGIKHISGAESQVGVICYQLGIIGFLLYLYFFKTVINHFFSRSTTFRKNGDSALAQYNLFVAASLAGLFMASFFQENTFGPQAGGVFFLFMGIVEQLNRIVINER